MTRGAIRGEWRACLPRRNGVLLKAGVGVDIAFSLGPPGVPHPSSCGPQPPTVWTSSPVAWGDCRHLRQWPDVGSDRRAAQHGLRPRVGSQPVRRRRHRRPDLHRALGRPRCAETSAAVRSMPQLTKAGPDARSSQPGMEIAASRVGRCCLPRRASRSTGHSDGRRFPVPRRTSSSRPSAAYPDGACRANELQGRGWPHHGHWKLSRCDWYWRVRAIRDGKPLPWSEARPFDVGGRRR